MKIEEYFTKLNDKAQQVFSSSSLLVNELGNAHHYSACLFEFAQVIPDRSEQEMLKTVAAQMEAATFSASLGLYRQAFSALRLAFEMGLGVVHFSVHKLEFQEWVNGKADIKWSKLTDEENGLFSQRFANAFFPEFKYDMGNYLSKARMTYRNLSEYVHGNYETWTTTSLEISFNKPASEKYFQNIKTVYEIIIYILCCRYLKSINAEDLDSIDFLNDEMAHIEYIRSFLGGPEDIR